MFGLPGPYSRSELLLGGADGLTAAGGEAGADASDEVFRTACSSNSAAGPFLPSGKACRVEKYRDIYEKVQPWSGTRKRLLPHV